jgi:hypothetical protein
MNRHHNRLRRIAGIALLTVSASIFTVPAGSASAHTPATPDISENWAGICTLTTNNFKVVAREAGWLLVLQYKASDGTWKNADSRSNVSKGQTVYFQTSKVPTTGAGMTPVRVRLAEKPSLVTTVHWSAADTCSYHWGG